MTDDIVARLREWEKPTVTQDDTLDLRQGADEIERLRAEVARLGSFIHPIGTTTYGIEDMYER